MIMFLQTTNSGNTARILPTVNHTDSWTTSTTVAKTPKPKGLTYRADQWAPSSPSPPSTRPVS